MDNVILLIWGDLLESDSLQFGFKSKVSTTQCSWVVNEVASHYFKAGTAINTALLDCSKVFDKCQFVLLDRNFPPIFVRLLIYEDNCDELNRLGLLPGGHPYNCYRSQMLIIF